MQNVLEAFTFYSQCPINGNGVDNLSKERDFQIQK